MTSKKALQRQAGEVEARAERKKQFVKALAQFLAGDQAKKSIILGMSSGAAFSLAKEWADLRAASPLMGYPSVDEAASQLNEWLSEF